MRGNTCADVEERISCAAENHAKDPGVDLDDILQKQKANPNEGPGDECSAPPTSEDQPEDDQ
jgi:hypothetical protein